MADGSEPLDPSIRCRPVGPDDEPFLQELYRTTRTDIPALGLDETEAAALIAMQFRAQQMQYAARANLTRDLVLLDDTPVGRFYYEPCERVVRLVDLAVLTRHRRRGIGTLLLTRVLDRAARRGHSVTLHVRRDNPQAERLYRRLGFTVSRSDQVHHFMEARPSRSR